MFLCTLAVQEGGWDDFPVFVWRQRYRGKELPAELVEPFGGTNVERDDPAAWVLDAGLDFYVGHGPGRNDLHLDADRPSWKERWDAWVETRDEELLLREPCLSDPETVERMERTLRASLAARDGNHGLGVSLGDEISLTPSGGIPWDGCRSPACRAAWGASRAMPLTDAVRLAWSRGEVDELGEWLALRRFHHNVVFGTLERLAASVDGPVGVLGLAGRTPFGGLSVSRAARRFDFVECYPLGDARQLLHSVRESRAETRSLLTVFLQDDTPAGVAWQAWEHWARGGDGLVVWSDAALEDKPEHAASLAEAVRNIRKLQRELGRFEPHPRGVAVVHDDDATSLSWLRDALLDGPTWPNRFPSHQEERGTREVAVRTWLRYFEDLGHYPGALPLAEVSARTVERFPVLVLAHVLALDDDDVENLGAFVDGGGLLLVEGELGTFDRNGRRRETEALEELRGRSAKRIVGAELDGYLKKRLRLRAEDRAALVDARVHAALGSAGDAVLRRRPAPSQVPWLVTRCTVADARGPVYAAVPNLTSPDERAAHLADARYLPAPVEGKVLRRIFPTEDGPWSPGSAMVFAILPR